MMLWIVLKRLYERIADDIKVASVTDNLTQCKKLQDQIDALLRWSDIWQMSFNTD